MAGYVCPTCGTAMARDLELFIAHTDKHIVDELKRLHPEWLTAEGYCPKCTEYFKDAMGKGTLGENIGPAEVGQRYLMAALGFGGALAVGGLLYSNQASKPMYNWLFPFLFAGFLGWSQARTRFCVVIARQHGPKSAKQRAYLMTVRAALLAAVVTAVTIVLG